MKSGTVPDSQIMEKKIDDIFKEGIHKKEMNLRPELWNRLERQLDAEPERRNTSFNWRSLMIAASVLVILSLTILLYLNIDRYRVEDLDGDIAPHFFKEEITNLEEVYWVPQQIFVNPSFE